MLNEEEKKAIELLKNKNTEYYYRFIDVRDAVSTLLNLIEKQQKEIEKIKDKNKTLEGLLQGNLFELYLYYKELASKYQANSISKDKIREKIKEITNYNYTSVEERECQVYARQVLKELLEENTNE